MTNQPHYDKQTPDKPNDINPQTTYDPDAFAAAANITHSIINTLNSMMRWGIPVYKYGKGVIPAPFAEGMIGAGLQLYADSNNDLTVNQHVSRALIAGVEAIGTDSISNASGIFVGVPIGTVIANGPGAPVGYGVASFIVNSVMEFMFWPKMNESIIYPQYNLGDP